MALAERALGRLADGGEGRGDQAVEIGAVGELAAEFNGAGAQILVRQRLDLGLQRVDRGDLWIIGLETAVIGRTEELASD